MALLVHLSDLYHQLHTETCIIRAHWVFGIRLFGSLLCILQWNWTFLRVSMPSTVLTIHVLNIHALSLNSSCHCRLMSLFYSAGVASSMFLAAKILSPFSFQSSRRSICYFRPESSKLIERPVPSAASAWEYLSACSTHLLFPKWQKISKHKLFSLPMEKGFCLFVLFDSWGSLLIWYWEGDSNVLLLSRTSSRVMNNHVAVPLQLKIQKVQFVQVLKLLFSKELSQWSCQTVRI